MPEVVRVVPEDLQVSAATVDVRADELWLRHGSADGRVEAAQVGVPVQAAAAISGALTKWQADTRALFGKLADIGEALRAAGVGYENTDAHNAARIEAVPDQVSATDLGM